MAEGRKIIDDFNSLAVSGNDEIRPPTVQSCSSCKDEDNIIDATQYCIDCEEYQCGKCSKYHDRYNRGHDVLDESNKMRWGEQKQTKLPTEKCSKHIGEVLQIYCENHEALCCHVCVAMEHSACNGKQYIPEVAKNTSGNEELQSLTDDIKNIVCHIDNVVGESERNKIAISRSVDDFDKLVAETRREINRIFDHLSNQARVKVFAEITRRISEMDATITTGREMVAQLKGLQLKIDPETTANKAQLFINIKQTKKNLDLISYDVKEISKAQPKSINFRVNEEMLTPIKTEGVLFEHEVINWFPTKIQMQSLNKKRFKTKTLLQRPVRKNPFPTSGYGFDFQ